MAGYLRFTKVVNDKTGEFYTGGEGMSIMFSVITGASQLSMLGPVMKAMTEAKIAGKLAFEFIDHVPDVDAKSPG